MCLTNPALTERLRSRDDWLEPIRRQWSVESGQARFDAHRREMIEGFRASRRALDEFEIDNCANRGRRSS